DQSKRISVINKLKNVNDVLEIYELLEPYDLLLKVRTYDIHSLKENVIHVLNNIDGVLESNSLLTTKCHKEKTCVMLKK
nr:Lrp/AsnC family transcriptional regulator [Methanomethylovorans sp.]